MVRALIKIFLASEWGNLNLCEVKFTFMHELNMSRTRSIQSDLLFNVWRGNFYKTFELGVGQFTD